MSLIDVFPRVGQLPPGMGLCHWEVGAKLAVGLLAPDAPAWLVVSPPEMAGATELWLDSRELAPGNHLLCIRSARWVFALLATPTGQVAHSFHPQVERRLWQDLLAQVNAGSLAGGTSRGGGGILPKMALPNGSTPGGVGTVGTA